LPGPSTRPFSKKKIATPKRCSPPADGEGLTKHNGGMPVLIYPMGIFFLAIVTAA